MAKKRSKSYVPKAIRASLTAILKQARKSGLHVGVVYADEGGVGFAADACEELSKRIKRVAREFGEARDNAINAFNDGVLAATSK